MKPSLKISLVYFVLGCLWILLSDRLAFLISDNIEFLTGIQTIKGWIFVVLSTLLIYSLTRRAFLCHAKAEAEKKEVFKGTVAGSCHILLNYLNQMQLIVLEAERSLDFDKSLLVTADRISKEACDELKKLESLDIKEAGDIETFIYRNLRNRPGRRDP